MDRTLNEISSHLNFFSASLHEAAICSTHKAVNKEILGHVPLGSACRPSLPCYTDSSRVPTYRKPLAGGGRLERYNRGISRDMPAGKE